jgi:uncharacterized membrane protein
LFINQIYVVSIIREGDYDLGFLSIFLMVFVLVVLITTTLLYLLLFYFKKINEETAYLITILAVGTMYLFIIRPNGVPDEWHHHDSSYNLAYQILGVDEFDPREDQDTIATPNAVWGYYNIHRAITGEAVEMSRIQIREKAAENNPGIFYIVPALGIVVGDILNFSNLGIFYLARFFNLLLFAFMSYYAIRRMPFGKMALATACLFPMTVHLAASFSPDGLKIASAFLFISIILDLVYKKEKMDIKDLVLIGVIGLILVISRGGVHWPVIGLLFLVGKKINIDIKRRILGVVGLIGIWIIGYLIMMLQNITTNMEPSYVVWTGVEEGFTLAYVLANPLQPIMMLILTMWRNVDFYLLSMIGNDLGWFDTPILLFTIFVFVIFFVLGTFREKEEFIKVTIKKKVIFASLLILSAGMAFGVMLLVWTPITFGIILGVQGRYFIPLIPLLIGVCQTDAIALKRNYNKELLLGLFLLQVYTMYQIIGSSIANS